MPRMVLLLGPLLAALPAAAAPPPPAAARVPAGDLARIKALYGTPDEAAGRCRLQLRGTELLVRTPETPHPGGYRLTREVSGDFDVRVKLVGLSDPPRAFGPSKGELLTEAGLIVGADGHFVNLRRYKQYHLLDGGEPQQGLDEPVFVDQFYATGGEGRRLADAPAGPVDLRVVRKGKAVSVLWSEDGKRWSESWPADKVTLPDRVTVSLFVSHGTDGACVARFDGFALTQPGKK